MRSPPSEPGGWISRSPAARATAGPWLASRRSSTTFGVPAPAGGLLLIGHTATRWALDHLLDGRTLEQVVTAPFDWREGWEYDLDPSPRAIAGTAA